MQSSPNTTSRRMLRLYEPSDGGEKARVPSPPPHTWWPDGCEHLCKGKYGETSARHRQRMPTFRAYVREEECFQRLLLLFFRSSFSIGYER